MDMNMLTIYLFTRLDSVLGVARFFCAAGGVATLVTGVGFLVLHSSYHSIPDRATGSEMEKEECLVLSGLWKRFLHPSALVFSCSLLIATLVPTQKEMAAIYLLPKLAKSDAAKQLQQVPDYALKLLNTKLQQYITEAIPPAKKEEK